MINDLVKSKNISIQKAISFYITEGLVQELSNLKKLTDSQSKKLCDLISIKTIENDIYHNNFNIMFDNLEVHEEFSTYLKKDSLVFKLEIPEMNVYIWAYKLSENSLLNNIIGDIND